MALFALLAEAAFVNVVPIVATHTGCRYRELLLGRYLVAGQAIQVFVPAIQFEFGSSVVIKIPGLPILRVVAELALRAQTALVLVFLVMTGNALDLGVFELRRVMALLALHLRMLA